MHVCLYISIQTCVHTFMHVWLYKCLHISVCLQRYILLEFSISRILTFLEFLSINFQTYGNPKILEFLYFSISRNSGNLKILSSRTTSFVSSCYNLPLVITFIIGQICTYHMSLFFFFCDFSKSATFGTICEACISNDGA